MRLAFTRTHTLSSLLSTAHVPLPSLISNTPSVASGSHFPNRTTPRLLPPLSHSRHLTSALREAGVGGETPGFAGCALAMFAIPPFPPLGRCRVTEGSIDFVSVNKQRGSHRFWFGTLHPGPPRLRLAWLVR